MKLFVKILIFTSGYFSVQSSRASHTSVVLIVLKWNRWKALLIYFCWAICLILWIGFMSVWNCQWTTDGLTSCKLQLLYPALDSCKGKRSSCYLVWTLFIVGVHNIIFFLTAEREIVTDKTEPWVVCLIQGSMPSCRSHFGHGSNVCTSWLLENKFSYCFQHILILLWNVLQSLHGFASA